MSQSRQLAAIMFTDIVGYTSLMGQDEQKAFDFLNKNRQIQKPIIEQYNGKWIKELGDGVIATFNTVSDAVLAAIQIQEQCTAANDFQLRIGIHQGEIVIEDNDVFGDAVNIASRIQSIALPGSIYVSEVVHHNVSNNNNILTEFVRTETLKNVKTPVRIYRVKLFGPDSSHSLPAKIRKKRILLFIAIPLLLLITGYLILNQNSKSKRNQPTSVEPTDRSIAVLPFVNMSKDPDQEYFSDGLSEELLNLLSKIPELKVIGRTSSFAFKGKNEDLRIIAEKLNVAHLLEGSVRKDGNMIRVTAQLIKAEDGSHLWSESYDRDLKGIFQLQDEIANAVVQQLKLKLLDFPSTRVSGTRNIEAYNLILQGNYFFDKLDKDNVAKAVEFYYKALTIDSTDARTWAALANAISRQAWQNYIDQNPGYEKARQAAIKAIALDSTLAAGHLELGDIKHYHDFDWKGAEESYRIALKLAPSDADVLTSLGSNKEALGRCREAEQFFRKALIYNPLKPIIYLDLGHALSCDSRYNEAIAVFNKILEINPQYQRAHMYIGRNYLMMGKAQQALAEMEKENMEIFKILGLALAYHALDRKKEADEKLKVFTETYGNDWNYLLAELHAFRGEKEKAFDVLENAIAKKDSWLVFLKVDPLLKNIRGDSRYDTILKKMNLTID